MASYLWFTVDEGKILRLGKGEITRERWDGKLECQLAPFTLESQ